MQEELPAQDKMKIGGHRGFMPYMAVAQGIAAALSGPGKTAVCNQHLLCHMTLLHSRLNAWFITWAIVHASRWSRRRLWSLPLHSLAVLADASHWLPWCILWLLSSECLIKFSSKCQCSMTAVHNFCWTDSCWTGPSL